MRTARSGTSGENLFDFFMTPSAQILEPFEKTGQFDKHFTDDASSTQVLAHNPSQLKHRYLCFAENRQ